MTPERGQSQCRRRAVQLLTWSSEPADTGFWPFRSVVTDNMRARYEWVAPYPLTREIGMKQNYIVLRTCFIYSMAMRMP